MKEYKVPEQSLIDHIKTAVDVDDWAKEMAEDLLKEQEPKQVETDMYGNAYCPWCSTEETIEMGDYLTGRIKVRQRAAIRRN